MFRVGGLDELVFEDLNSFSGLLVRFERGWLLLIFYDQRGELGVLGGHFRHRGHAYGLARLVTVELEWLLPWGILFVHAFALVGLIKRLY